MPAYAVGSSILVQGQKLSDAIQAYVEEVVVDDDLHSPSMFAITLRDPRRDIVGRAGMQPGAEVEIVVEDERRQNTKPLLVGDVVTIECDYDEIGARVVVRGYDASHRLHIGRRTQVFRNVTDDDIVKQVAEQAGLTVQSLEPATEVHEHVTQPNITGWDFLIDRVRAMGRDLMVAGKEITLKAPTTAADAPSEAGSGADAQSIDPRHLVFGMNLIAFHGRISAAEQVGRIEVRGYDETKKEAVVATAQPGTVAAGVAQANPRQLGTIFGDPAFVHVTKARTAGEVADAAKAVAERIGSGFAEVDGTARGNTVLRAGVAVRVSRVSEQFNGAYVLSKARHVIDRSGYRTHFSVSGRHNRSLLGLVSQAAPAGGSGEGHAPVSGSRLMNTLVRGIVSDVKDPDSLARVKVRLPWLDDSFSSQWAPVLQLGAGPDSGTVFLPAVGDEVLVGFEHGSIDRPIVVGGLFNAIDKPPTYGQFIDDGKVTGRTIVSRKGHELTFLDGDDLTGIQLMAVDDNRSPVVSISLDGKESKLVIQTSKDISVEAEGDVSMKGKKISVEAQSTLVLKGARVEIN
jgi:phage protein D/phage baseplate assembly protein gpV